MKTSTARLGLISMVLILSAGPLSHVQEVPGGPDYCGLSVEVQLLIADIKLDEMIQSGEAAGDQIKLENLKQAQDLLWKALLLYKHYETGDAKYLGEHARQNYS